MSGELHRCALPGCTVPVARREGEAPSDYRQRRYCTHEHRIEGRTRTRNGKSTGKGARRAPVPALRVCQLDGCGELIPLPEGHTPTMYARLRYHSTDCSNLGRSRTLASQRATLAPRRCEGCGVEYLPARKTQRFHDKPCALGKLQQGRTRQTKVCQCGCMAVFERPRHMAEKAWEKRRFVDAEHRKRAPGESRKGNRTEPKPKPSRDRKPQDQPKPRKVFDGPPPPAPWRPPVPVVVRVERTVPRPSFGLTRRSA